MLTLFCTGCLLNSREDFEKLPDKKFYFSEFQFILRGQSKEQAYDFYHKFPVKKIMYMLAREYNITIDISDFNNFRNTKDLSGMEEDGFLRTAKYKWRKKSDAENKIIFIFQQDYFESDQQKFKIGIYRGASSLKTIDVETSKIDYIFSELKLRLKSGKESLNEYNENNYDKISPVPQIIESERTSPLPGISDDII